MEAGGWWLEAGGWGEAGSWKLEAEGWRLEAGGRKFLGWRLEARGSGGSGCSMGWRLEAWMQQRSSRASSPVFFSSTRCTQLVQLNVGTPTLAHLKAVYVP